MSLGRDGKKIPLHGTVWPTSWHHCSVHCPSVWVISTVRRVNWRPQTDIPFIKLDPDNITTESCIVIPGLKTKLYQYQWLGVYFVLKKTHEGINGAVIADEMGFGKVSN